MYTNFFSNSENYAPFLSQYSLLWAMNFVRDFLTMECEVLNVLVYLKFTTCFVAVLVLFLHNQLNFNENTSTALYHGFIVLCYLLPLFGAFISDSCLGKYKYVCSTQDKPAKPQCFVSGLFLFYLSCTQ